MNRLCAITLAALLLLPACRDEGPASPATPSFASIGNVHSGKQIFRFDTFGNERFWTDSLGMHQVVQSIVSPQLALSVGLDVDADAVPKGFLRHADLTSPATTVQLLARNAVIGIKAEVQKGQIVRLGITCALCHAATDNSVAPGIGKRMDGWPNSDLNVGAIVALSDSLTPAQKAVYNSWGPGMYDPRFNIDGINGPVVIPAAYGLAGVSLETYTGEGPISYWNAYVAVTQMHGQGSFSEPALGINVVNSPDLVTPKLAALLQYQLSLTKPAPPPGFFDPAAAQRGQALFASAGCVSCHLGPTFSDANLTLHDPSETGMDPQYAGRGTTGKYRTTPLRGLWQHTRFFHDGSATTLAEVVNHYNTFFGLGLMEGQKADLTEYLKSL